MFRNGIAEGNMALSAGILLSGMTWSSFWRALSITDVQKIVVRTFCRTHYECTELRNNIIQNLKTENLMVTGDGRYDSPGHNAK